MHLLSYTPMRYWQGILPGLISGAVIVDLFPFLSNLHFSLYPNILTSFALMPSTVIFFFPFCCDHIQSFPFLVKNTLPVYLSGLPSML